jgi:hypothetical protein
MRGLTFSYALRRRDLLREDWRAVRTRIDGMGITSGSAESSAGAGRSVWRGKRGVTLPVRYVSVTLPSAPTE